MIETLRIESFKSITGAELDLGQVNVFIGANGSGKSNLLEALALLSAAASGKVDQSTLVWRGARASGYYRPMFEGVSPLAEILLEAKSKDASYRVALHAPEHIRPDSWHYSNEVLLGEGDVVADRSKLRMSGGLDPESGYAALKLAETNPGNPASSFLKSLAAYSIYSPDTPILHGWVKDPQEREPVGLGGGRLAGALDELLNSEKLAEALNEEFHASIDWFGGFLMANFSGGDELYFKDRYFRKGKVGTSVLGTNDVNEGVLYLAFLAVLGLHPRSPRLFAVENVDHRLNPLLAKRLMTSLSERILASRAKRQVFLTTHNPLVLDGLPLQDDRVRLFTVDRDNRGRSIIRRFVVTDKHREMASKGWTLSRMWINKLIGGVPDV